jgi:hypothetical protein
MNILLNKIKAFFMGTFSAKKNVVVKEDDYEAWLGI